MSRSTPPKMPVITPISEAMNTGMCAVCACDTPATANRPRPMASAMTIRRSETIWRSVRISGVAISASTKIKIAYSWCWTQNSGRLSSRMSRSVPPPKAVMKATVNTPTRSMRLRRASMKPENAPTRIAMISMMVINETCGRGKCENISSVQAGPLGRLWRHHRSELFLLCGMFATRADIAHHAKQRGRRAVRVADEGRFDFHRDEAAVALRQLRLTQDAAAAGVAGPVTGQPRRQVAQQGLGQRLGTVEVVAEQAAGGRAQIGQAAAGAIGYPADLAAVFQQQAVTRLVLPDPLQLGE